MKKTIFEKVEAEVITGAENYIKNKVKKKLFRLGEISFFIFMSFILISFGLALIIGKYFPLVDGGFNFIILGALFLLVGFLLK